MKDVLTDTEGEIIAFFVCTDIDAIGNTTILNDLAKYLPSASLWVKSSHRFSAHTQIGGILGNAQNRFHVVGLYNHIFSEYKNAGFDAQSDFSNWLTENLPYSPSFSLLEVTNELGEVKTIDLKCIAEIKSRFDSARKMHKLFPRLEFNFVADIGYWTGDFGGDSIRIKANSASHSNLAPSKLAWRQKSLNDFNTLVNKYSLNWDERFLFSQDEVENHRKIDWSIPSTAGAYGIDSIGNMMRKWPQDQIVVRQFKNQSELRLPHKDSIPDGLFRDYCSLTFVQNDDFCWNSGADPLNIPGGNMHICKNLVFVGRNAASLYCKEDEWEHSTVNWEEVAEKIIADIFGQTEDKKLIWVGVTSKGTDALNEDFQPVYHSDLFFQPLGFFNNRNGVPIFRYIFAQPQIACILPPVPERTPECLDVLFNRFKCTHDSIKKQLSDIDIVSEPICIDLPIRFIAKQNSSDMDWSNISLTPSFDQYWSFSNGLINRKNDKIEFLLADYDVIGVSQCVIDAQNAAHREIERAIDVLRIVKIKGKELTDDEKGGLRCYVKVLARSF